MYKVKIAVVGPSECGKTHISNHVAEATEMSRGEYRPTQGVRILEFESTIEDEDTAKAFRAEVELWDCGGSSRFETCWPAFARDVNGVLIVFNPNKPHQERQLEKWFTYFVKKQRLKVSQCLLVAHQQPSYSSEKREMLNSAILASLQCVDTNSEDDPDAIKDLFLKFLTNICSSFKATQDQEEEVIINYQKL